MKIFYSWQSDLENRFNRSFIKKALEKAIGELNVDLNISEPDRQIELDHDTKNVPGTPDLANTILEKISSSKIFIADISFIAKREDSEGNKPPKKIPNPNVLIELGYALAKLGSDKVICVFNTATGDVADLPFDLRHKRHPIQYHLDDNSADDKKQQENNLVSTLKNAVKPIVEFEKYRTTTMPPLSSNPSREDIMNAIMSSDSEDDWERVAIRWEETVYFKKNVNLRFEMEFNENGTQYENFKEPWANKHPDPNASGYWCKLYYGATHIDSYILVSVDGGRALLPLPKSINELTINPLSYKVAQIHDSLGTLNQYMARSGLTLENKKLESMLTS